MVPLFRGRGLRIAVSTQGHHSARRRVMTLNQEENIMKTANDSVREDRENYLVGVEEHIVTTLKLAGEVQMGISMDSLRP